MIRVLFVCTGNTCRSPMAEAILKGKKLPNVEVKSAGVYTIDGNALSQNSELVLKENNLHSSHRTSLLTNVQIDWATHILTMTNNHKNYLIENYPDSIDKVFTLYEFVDLEGDVQDPYGGSKQVYESTFVELNELVTKASEKIRLLMMEDTDGQKKTL